MSVALLNLLHLYIVIFMKYVRPLSIFLTNFLRFRFRRRPLILWGNIGLGDQILSARTIEIWASRVETLHLPVKNRNFDTMSELFRYVPNLRLHSIVDDPIYECEQIANLSRRLAVPILRGGNHVLPLIQRIFPNYGLNHQLSLTCLVKLDNLSSSKFCSANGIRTDSEFEGGYAFVDNHPGTDREIPQWVIEDILCRGLQAIFNDPRISFAEMMKVMAGSKELYLVGSAPLCTALVLNLKKDTQIYFKSSKGDFLKSDDAGNFWTTYDIASEAVVGYPPPVLSRFTRGIQRTFQFFLLRV